MENLKDRINIFLKNEYYIKYQPLFLPVIAGIICLLLLLFTILPQFAKERENQKNLKQIQEKISFYNQKAAALKNIEPGLYKDNLSAALLALPDDRDIPGIITQIQTLLLETGLFLDGITFTNPSIAGSTVNNYQVKIEITGDLVQTKKFISKMQESSRLVKLTQIQLSSSGLKEDKIQVSMEFTAFFQPLPQKITNLDQEIPKLSDSDNRILSKLKESVSSIQLGGTAQSTADITGRADPFK